MLKTYLLLFQVFVGVGVAFWGIKVMGNLGRKIQRREKVSYEEIQKTKIYTWIFYLVMSLLMVTVLITLRNSEIDLSIEFGEVLICLSCIIVFSYFMATVVIGQLILLWKTYNKNNEPNE